MTLKLAIIGTGYIGKIHARAAKNTQGVSLEAIVSRACADLETFRKDFQVPRCYEDMTALLREGGVDAVVIATPNYLHAPMTVQALEQGVHVLVEKPMAMDVSEAGQMIAAGQRSGALLMVAHCWRFDEEVLWLKKQVEAGRLGRIVRTKGYGVHTWWGPSGWFTQKKAAGGGALADMGIHAIDAARFLLGEPKPSSVYARIGAFYKESDVDDTGMILVNWENGATSYIESGWWQPHMDGPEASTQLYGTEGFGQVFPTYLELPDNTAQAVARIDPGYPPVREEHCPQGMYDSQMAYFIECIRTGCQPVPGGREGLINVCIVNAAYESARTGEVVRL